MAGDGLQHQQHTPTRAIQNQPGYYRIKALSTLAHRYIFEDVPMSLVPIASLGQHFGVGARRSISLRPARLI